MACFLTDQMIEQAQQRWADHLLAIGKAYQTKQDYRQHALAMLDSCYGYDLPTGIVLFKPTRAVKIPFRNTREGALSYFIAGDDNFPEDKGFALEAWSNVTFRNHNTFCQDQMGLVMGEYLFSRPNQPDTLVEYTFGYTPDLDGELKIILHHSSLPAQVS